MTYQRHGAYAVVVALIVVVAALAASACDDDANGNGEGDNETPVTTPEAQATQEPSTEISVEGQSASMVIEPSVDEAISGVVTITVSDTPSDTIAVFFAMTGPGTEDLETTGPNLGIDEDGSDGWSRMFDTTAYENGLYEIAGLPMTDADSDPAGIVRVQVIIEN